MDSEQFLKNEQISMADASLRGQCNEDVSVTCETIEATSYEHFETMSQVVVEAGSCCFDNDATYACQRQSGLGNVTSPNGQRHKSKPQ